ncbi:MAG: phosphatase PAP2 family protein [Mesorhizobium sp.]|uniref:phosphatase PAP2 family protein n=1 Tax=Mesorhizobium sp. TaxID=1871066 RepID=UPI000FEA5F61|nr:phosphatase PAP2 family protein [Mesorhizobium sp.]RWE77333.1 MAG: phosphatase PAP2 family protein [Mesorhizobium sp.]
MRFDDTLRLVAAVVAVTVGFVIADIFWAADSNVAVDGRSFIEFGKVMAMLAMIYVILLLIDRRVAGDNTRMARAIIHASASVRSLVWNAGLFIPLGFASVYFMYLASATDRPLMDETLAVIDAHMWFRWRAFLELTNSVPIVAKVLVFAYHSLGPQLPLLFIVLAFIADQRLRLTEFMSMLAVSSALTATIMAFVSAAGAYAYFQPVAADFSNFTPHAGMWHYQELLRLRSGEPFSLLVTRAEGLATFPSYHTVLGILVVYALRDLPALAWPVGVLNALMVVSTLPEGGHHLTDVLAGAAVGVTTVMFTRALQYKLKPAPLTVAP